MKLRAPDDCCAASHAGQIIEISEDGSVEVEEHLQATLISHGFAVWERQTGSPSPPESAQSQPRDSETRPAPEAAPAIDFDISTLGRRELFAYRKAKGISVRLPMTNQELRAAACLAHDR